MANEQPNATLNSPNAAQTGQTADQGHHAVSPWARATAGTYVDSHVPRAIQMVFAALVMVALLVPSVGMIWAPTMETTENRVLAPLPSLTDENGAPNVGILSDLGTYFEDHFALRNQMVAADARLNALFGVSGSSQVILGSNGWLYYAGTLPDYQGTAQLSDAALAHIAHNLRMVQDYVEAHGARFVFTIAPNKNSLYPEHMPYYYLASDADGNVERLLPLLADEGVAYVDLFAVLSAESEVRYLSTDTHWDNIGALIGGNAILEGAGVNRVALDPAAAAAREDFVGDLESMLYPDAPRAVDNYYFEGVNDGEGFAGSSWRYVEGSSVEDDWIQAQGPDRGSNLLVFRDSFGNALLPYWASTNRSVTFSKLIPYNIPIMTQVSPDVVIIERAERHLDYLARTAPIMPAPLVPNFNMSAWSGAPSASAELSATTDGAYLVLSGTIDQDIANRAAEVYVCVKTADGNQRVYRSFLVSSVDEDDAITADNRFVAYSGAGPSLLDGATVSICVLDVDGAHYQDEIAQVHLQ